MVRLWRTIAPYLSYIFSEAIKIGKSKVLCYVNADIIFLPGVIEVVDFIKSKFDKFLIVGRRWEVEIIRINRLFYTELAY